MVDIIPKANWLCKIKSLIFTFFLSFFQKFSLNSNILLHPKIFIVFLTQRCYSINEKDSYLADFF